MNNHYVIEENWTGIILQWLFLFGLLSIPLVSGWFFGRLAKQNNNKRWVFFIVGVAIFIAGIVVGGQIEYLFLRYSAPRENGYSISGILRLPFAILMSVTLYFVLKREWTKTSNRK